MTPAKKRKLTALERQLLAAMKASVALADRNMAKHFSGRTPQCQKIYDRCVAAIHKAETMS